MDMATAATPTATHVSRNYYYYSSISSLHRKNLFMLTTPRLRTHQTTSSNRLSLVKASKPETGRAEEEINSDATDKPTFLPQEDLNYLMKLGGGSVAGAAAIKYGSIIFPEITRPNIGQALIMIIAPVLVAVLLLIKQSRPQ